MGALFPAPIVYRFACWIVATVVCLVPVLAAEPLEPIPLPRFHLTARPPTPLRTSTAEYLAAVEGICRYLARQQDERGAIVDPFLGREHQYATPYFAYPVGVLLAAGRAPDLREAGVRAMEHATACLAAGSQAIPDRHGEFFLAPLAEALELYRPHVDEPTWSAWQKRLQTPLAKVIEGHAAHTNNWRTYAMKGEWLRARAGLVDRDSAAHFVADAWRERTQRERIGSDRWNLYQDWSSDPQSHAVEAVGRGNLLALVAADYNGPYHAEIADCARRGSEAALLWQDPTGQCPPNGRADNHVFNDVLYQLACELMAEDALVRGQCGRAAQFRRSALLSFRSIARWRREDRELSGSYFVTKNHFDPRQRVGYQPASQYTNYNATLAYHLAEASRVRRSVVAEQAAPTEIGGYVVAADPAFASVVANAGGMQIVANLRGDTVTKYGAYWTPLGVVRFSRAGWDSRLGPPDGVHDAASRRGVTFAPTWREGDRWVHLAERAADYRGTLTTEYVHPLLVRFSILYHPATGQGGPTFRHEFTLTSDGVFSLLTCGEDRAFGVTLPVLVDDGRPLEVQLTPPCITTAYPTSLEPSGDQQCFLLLGNDPQVEALEPITSAVGRLRPVRVAASERRVAVFIYPRSAGDPTPADVLTGFQVHEEGFDSCLGHVRGSVYRGRTAAGGSVARLSLGDGNEVCCAPQSELIVQLHAGRTVAIESDRPTQVRLAEGTYQLEAFAPRELLPGGRQE